jgi:hypothetical protein
MRIWGKLAVAAAAPLLLTGCLWGPGKFTSTLALNKAGTFVLDYRGEIMLQMPDEKTAPGPWSNDLAVCHKDGSSEASSGLASVALEPPSTAESDMSGDGSEERPCSAAEIAKLKTEYEKQAAEAAEKKRKESDEMAKIFGLPGSDDESNKRFAANLMKHQGWRSVTYKGKGLFDVDYHFEGRLNQDFAFPLMPESDLMIPFITIRPRTDGSVKVSAPAFTGGSGPFGARAKMMGLPDKGSEGPVSRAQGRFTITTDAEILTNNSEEGPVAVQGRREVHWDVDAGSSRIPEMMVRL